MEVILDSNGNKLGKKKYKDATSPRPVNKAGQATETPNDFFTACNTKFNFTWDLAADFLNAKVDNYIDEQINSFKVEWYKLSPGNYLWLNPPFADIRPWALKCVQEMVLGAKIAFLVPASVDSNWYGLYVEPYATMRWLNPRLKFVGHKTSYPKPMMLAVYDKELRDQWGSSTQWDWVEEDYDHATQRMFQRRNYKLEII